MLAKSGNGYDTALCAASGRGHINIVKYLINQGADVDQVEANGAAPIHQAVLNGHLEVVQYLIDSEAEFNKGIATADNQPVLHIAARIGHFNIFELLLRAGADPTLLTDDEMSALAFAKSDAARAELTAIISRLWYDSPISKACYDNDLAALRQLVTEPDIDQRVNAVAAAAPGQGSWSSLHVCSFMNRLEAVEILIANGADLSLVTSDNGGGLTALHLASSRGHSEMVVLLLRAMAAKSVVAAAADGSSSSAAIEPEGKKAKRL